MASTENSLIYFFVKHQALPMGTIMLVVAVFDIHMERNMVGSIRPSMSSLGLVPMVMRALSAILWWRLHFSTAMAVIREPQHRQVEH